MELVIILVLLAVGVWWVKRARRSTSKLKNGFSTVSSSLDISRRDGQELSERPFQKTYGSRSASSAYSGTVIIGEILAPSAPSDACWIPANETIEISGHTVDGGLIYVGTSLPSPKGYGNDNCLVNTRSKVASSRADIAGQSMSYCVIRRAILTPYQGSVLQAV